MLYLNDDHNWTHIAGSMSDEIRDNVRTVQYRNEHENKDALDAIHIVNPDLRAVYKAFVDTTRTILREITFGLDIVADPACRGCGLHRLPPGGFLGLHYDGNWHPDMKMRRYANAVYYVTGNPNDYFHHGNDLISLRPGRLVIFKSATNVIHGVPKPVNSERLTLSTFFYINGPEPKNKHRAVFVGADPAFTAQRSALP